jgi:uncharacterized coiled-coil protein SlyX
MPDRNNAPIRLPLPKPKPFAEHVTSWYGIATIFIAVAGAGASLHAFSGTKADATSLAGKADAAPVASLSSAVAGDHDRLGRIETRVDDLTEEVRGMRVDLREAQAGRTLPPLPPVKKTP